MIDKLILSTFPEVSDEESDEENEKKTEISKVPKKKLIEIYEKNLKDLDYANRFLDCSQMCSKDNSVYQRVL